MLLEHMEQQRDKYASLDSQMEYATLTTKHLATATNNCWAKLKEYYALFGDSTDFSGSIVIHPSKWEYLEDQWIGSQAPWLALSKNAVQSLFASYKEEAVDSPKPRNPYGPIGQTNLLSEYMKLSAKALTSKAAKMSYEQYLERPHDDLKDLLNYWHVQEKLRPDLAQLAYDMLSIPAMSTECERLFSSAKLLLTDQRQRLKDDIIEANECLRAWQRQLGGSWAWVEEEENQAEEDLMDMS